MPTGCEANMQLFLKSDDMSNSLTLPPSLTILSWMIRCAIKDFSFIFASTRSLLTKKPRSIKRYPWERRKTDLHTRHKSSFLPFLFLRELSPYTMSLNLFNDVSRFSITCFGKRHVASFTKFYFRGVFSIKLRIIVLITS